MPENRQGSGGIEVGRGYSEWAGGDQPEWAAGAGPLQWVTEWDGARRWWGTGWRKKNRHGIKRRMALCM